MKKETKDALLDRLVDIMLDIEKGVLSVSAALSLAEPTISALEEAGYKTLKGDSNV